MGSRNSNRRVVGVILIAFLSLWIATAGGVATAAGQPLDDDTNVTDSTETNDTLDDFDTVISVAEATLDGTSGPVDGTTETVDGTGGTVDGTTEPLDGSTDTVNSTDTLQNTTDTVDATLDGANGSLATYEAVIELLLVGEAVLDDTTGTLGGSATGDETATATQARSDSPNETGTSSGADPTVGDAGRWSVLSGVNSDLPSAPTDDTAVVGFGLVVAGVAARQLTGTTGALQGINRGASRALDRLFRLFAPFRYSQHDDSDPLDHEKRAAVFEAVTDSPGVYLAALSEQLDVSRSTLRHHARVLEDEDLIAAARVRGYRRFYPANTEAVELAAALNDEATAPIVDALGRLGSATVSGLADVVDRDVSTVTYHLRRLQEDGVVVREREGRAMVNRLAPEAREALTPTDATGTDAAKPEREAPVSAD